MFANRKHSDCPEGQSCYIADFDCSKPQRFPTISPVELPTQSPSTPPEPAVTTVTTPEPASSEEDNNSDNMGIDNEGEEWAFVDNEGEDWSTNKPTNAPFPRPPTTNSPTIDLLGRLEDLQETYYCAVSWDQIDCDNAIPCPSGDAKGEAILIVIV